MNPVTLVAAIVPLPVVPRDAPVPMSAAMIVFVPVVSAENAVPPPPLPQAEPAVPSLYWLPETTQLTQSPFAGVAVN